MPPHTTKGQQQFKNKKQPELTGNQTIWKSDNQGDKKKHSSRPVGGSETGSWGGEDRGRAVAGRPREVADCGAGRAKLQLASEAAAGGLGDRPRNPQFQRGEIKPQTTD